MYARIPVGKYDLTSYIIIYLDAWIDVFARLNESVSKTTLAPEMATVVK